MKNDSDNQGVDFLFVLQAGGGIIGAVLRILILLRYGLHII
jgi:hypothetical protein